MASCKQCFRYEACKYMYEAAFDQQWFPFGTCDRFIDSSRIVELPCNIGDPVWFVGTSTANKLNKGVIETSVEKLVVKKGGIYMKLACNAMYETSCKSIGKTVFFTQAEAEAALAKMKGGAENA